MKKDFKIEKSLIQLLTGPFQKENGTWTSSLHPLEKMVFPLAQSTQLVTLFNQTSIPESIRFTQVITTANFNFLSTLLNLED